MSRDVDIKSVIESDNWIITKIKQGFNGVVLVNAKTRFHIADGVNRVSEWRSKSYIDKICRSKYGKNSNELSFFEY